MKRRAIIQGVGTGVSTVLIGRTASAAASNPLNAPRVIEAGLSYNFEEVEGIRDIKHVENYPLYKIRDETVVIRHFVDRLEEFKEANAILTVGFGSMSPNQFADGGALVEAGKSERLPAKLGSLLQPIKTAQLTEEYQQPNIKVELDGDAVHISGEYAASVQPGETLQEPLDPVAVPLRVKKVISEREGRHTPVTEKIKQEVSATPVLNIRNRGQKQLEIESQP